VAYDRVKPTYLIRILVYLTTLQRDLTISFACFYPILLSLPPFLLPLISTYINWQICNLKKENKTPGHAFRCHDFNFHLQEFTLKIVFHYQISLLNLPKSFLGASGGWNTE
jgi:hypothetical protein